jgi:hypothetical protein
MTREPLAHGSGAEEKLVAFRVGAQRDDGGGRGRERHGDECQQERHDERSARAARALLAREEIHGGEPRD